jgi:hypothetical protein
MHACHHILLGEQHCCKETRVLKQLLRKIGLSHLNFFSSPCQRQCELLPSLGISRPLTFHILIFSSETPQPNIEVI